MNADSETTSFLARFRGRSPRGIKIAFLFIACLGLAGAASVAGAITASRLPPNERRDAALHLPRQTVDLGAVAPGKELKVVFAVANRGGRRLVINEVDGGCNCGLSTAGTILLRPGEDGELVLNIDTHAESGMIERVAAFTTNDPLHPGFKLTVRAEVASPASPPAASPFDRETSVLVSPQAARNPGK